MAWEGFLRVRRIRAGCEQGDSPGYSLPLSPRFANESVYFHRGMASSAACAFVVDAVNSGLEARVNDWRSRPRRRPCACVDYPACVCELAGSPFPLLTYLTRFLAENRIAFRLELSFLADQRPRPIAEPGPPPPRVRSGSRKMPVGELPAAVVLEATTALGWYSRVESIRRYARWGRFW